MSFGFGKALDVLRGGDAVTREGWNGPGQRLVYVPGSQIEVAADRPLGHAMPDLVGQTVTYRAHIDIVQVEPHTGVSLVSTWVPSIGDTLAEDWDYAR